MVTYYSFYVYALMLAIALFAGLVAIRRRNAEQALTMLVVCLLAWIGLSTAVNEWYRVFAGIFHIVVDSWG